MAEKPSLLYCKDAKTRSWLTRYSQDSSTDSEEKDSDSGYSSPLHRRNQASNGTHPVVGMVPPYLQTTVIPVSESPSRHPYQSYMPAPNQPTVPCAYPVSPQSAPSNPNHPSLPASFAAIAACVPPQPLPHHASPLVTNSVHIPGIASFSNVVPSSGASNPNMSSSAAKTPTEEEDSAASRKKRRRNNRRRKNKGLGDDEGGLSDDPYSGQRRQSRPITLERDIDLHFDDEDEFPNLLSAAGGLPSSSQSSQSTPGHVTYSDILKNQSVSRSDIYKYNKNSQYQYSVPVKN